MGFKDFFNKVFSGNEKQLKPKAQLSVGGYEAAAFSRDRSYIYNTVTNSYPQQDSYSRQEIVRLTRYLVNNYSLFERILSVAEIYGVGSGIVANAATTDDEYNTTNTALFDSWADNQFCSNNQQYNFYEMQKLIVRELLIAGEVFIVLQKTQSNYPQLMLVRSEDVRKSNQQGDESIDGLNIDAYGKVVSYNICLDNENNVFQTVDASNVVHLMRHKQIGQLRGVSAFAASLNTARDHKDCIILEKKAIKTHAALAAIVTRESGNASTDPVFGNVAPSGEFAPTATGTPAPNVGLERAFGGAVVYANPDEDVKLLQSGRSTEGFRAFLELLLRDVCLNLSIPYEFLVNAEKLTGTGVRFAIGDAAFFFSNLQTILTDGALNRVYGWVTASNIKAGNITPPDTDGFNPYALSWTKPISVTVDQQKASTTEISLLQNGLLTYEAYYSARGKDWKQELKQRAKEEQFLDTLSKRYRCGY